MGNIVYSKSQSSAIKKTISTLLKSLTPKQAYAYGCPSTETLYGGSAGGGKIVANDGVVLTPTGFKKGIDLRVGDIINNPNGREQTIIEIKPEVCLDKWIVEFEDGTKTDVAKDHLWTTYVSKDGIYGITKETQSIKKAIEVGIDLYIPVCNPQEFNDMNELDIYSYIGEFDVTEKSYLDFANRKKMIQYFMDFNGIYNKDENLSYFFTESKKIVENVAFFIRSIGGIVTITEQIFNSCESKMYKATIEYTNQSNLYKYKKIDFKFSKPVAVKKQISRVYIDGKITGRCITVSNPNGLYITNDFIVTHNSYLARVSCILYCLQIPDFPAALFRRTSTSLIENHLGGAGGFIQILAPLVQVKVCKITMSPLPIITFENGSTIRLKHLNHVNDLGNIHGGEYGFLAFDEAIAFPLDALLEINSRIRLTSDVLNAIPSSLKKTLPRTMYMTNPVVLGDDFFADTIDYFKSNFVNASKSFVVQDENDLGDTRCYIPARLIDNPYIDKRYEKKLKGMADKAKRDALLYGDWDSMDGGGAFAEWSPDVHIIEPFNIPENIKVRRGYDYGLSSPYAFLWYIVANGEEIELTNGDVFCPPKGSKIFIHEYYGGDERDKGLVHTMEEVATNAMDAEEYIKSNYNVEKIYAGNADNSIWSTESTHNTIAGQLSRYGLLFKKSNKSKGSRVHGLQKVKSMLAEAKKDMPEKECLYIVKTCKNTIRTFPTLPLDKNSGIDVETKHSADHCYDIIRYVCFDGSPKQMRILRDGGLF